MEENQTATCCIRLQEIDPLTLYGVNNCKYNRLASHFPTLRIVARGEEIRAEGSEDELQRLAETIELLTAYYCKYGELTEQQMVHLLAGGAQQEPPATTGDGEVLVYAPRGKTIRARTPNQRLLVERELQHDLLFAVGPAGTGKTYTAIALAVRALKQRAVRRIVLTRPAVEAGERLGFLPGDMKEKLDPYLQPLYDALNDMLPPRTLMAKMEEGTIQIAPLAFMRGRTLDNAYVILDEAQNATLGQLKMFLTRMGRNAKFIVTGDASQIDLPDPKASGLTRVIKMLEGIEGVTVIRFEQNDMVRHPLVRAVVEAFDREARKHPSGEQ